MFTYKIYVGVWNETVERSREDAIKLLGSWSARLISIELTGKPYTGKIIKKSKLP